MTCPKCASKMYRSNLNYEFNGIDNFSVFEDNFYYKCPLCGYHHFPRTENKKKTFVAGQKIKGVPVDVE